MSSKVVCRFDNCGIEQAVLVVIAFLRRGRNDRRMDIRAPFLIIIKSVSRNWDVKYKAAPWSGILESRDKNLGGIP